MRNLTWLVFWVPTLQNPDCIFTPTARLSVGELQSQCEGGHMWLVASTVGGVGLCPTLPPPACHTARVAMISCLTSLCPTFPVCQGKITTPVS